MSEFSVRALKSARISLSSNCSALQSAYSLSAMLTSSMLDSLIDELALNISRISKFSVSKNSIGRDWQFKNYRYIESKPLTIGVEEWLK